MPRDVTERDARILEMYRRGLPYRDIAYVCDCTENAARKVVQRHPEVKQIVVCKVCGKTFERRKTGPVPSTCGKDDCKKQWHRVYAREWKRKNTADINRLEQLIPEGPNGKIRPYTDASDMMIRWDLGKEWSIMQMAIEYGRSPKDLKRHIREAGLRDDKRGVKGLPISKKRDRAAGR